MRRQHVGRFVSEQVNLALSAGRRDERRRITEQIKEVNQRMQEIAPTKDMQAMAETFAEKLLDEVEQE